MGRLGLMLGSELQGRLGSGPQVGAGAYLGGYFRYFHLRGSLHAILLHLLLTEADPGGVRGEDEGE